MGPFTPDLNQAGPVLAKLLHSPEVALIATSGMGDIPGPDAQQALADVLLNLAQPAALRVSASNQLARSIARFGPLLTAEQEAGLINKLQQETTPMLRIALSQVVGALRPKSLSVGERLRTFQAVPTDGTVPSPPEPRPSDEGTDPLPGSGSQ